MITFATTQINLNHNCAFCCMEKFEVTILGCGSATPTLRHLPTAQVLNVRDKLFLIDCAEGTQLQLRRGGFKFSAIRHIFISHLHGDHCLGLPGLVSTFALHGYYADLHIYAPIGAEALFRPLFDFFCPVKDFKVIVHEIDTTKREVIYEDRSVKVTTLPLAHRMPTCGFLFEEAPLLPNIKKSMIDFLKIPHYDILTIKQGKGWTAPDGKFYATETLTTPAPKARSYAYCSDTMPVYSNKDLLEGVSLLFHEATFADADLQRAKNTGHSTARQAAKFAADVNAENLLIGHFSARYPSDDVLLNEAKELFAPTYAAKELMTYQVGAPFDDKLGKKG